MAIVGPTPEQLGEVQRIQLPNVEGQGFQRGTGAVTYPLIWMDLGFLPVCSSLALRVGVLGFGLRFSAVFLLQARFVLNLGLNPRCVYH